MYRKHDGSGYRYSPTDLTIFLESPFTAWMNRANLESPGRFERDPEDAALQLVAEKGNEHEARVLESLRREFGITGHSIAKDFIAIDRSVGTFDTQSELTLEAMRSGARIIYQAALSRDPFFGYADFLIRREIPEESAPSRLGRHYYEAWDSKLARSEKPYFVIQLLCYSEMLAAIQGHFPESLTVILGTMERKTLPTRDYADYYAVLKERFLEFQRGFDPERPPVPEKGEMIRGWNLEARKIIEGKDHLSQVANIRKTQIAKLEGAGITTLEGLAKTSLARIPDLEQSTFQKLKKQAELQLRSRGKEVPEYELKEHTPGAREGLARLPPFSAGDVYFDMEGYPLHDESSLEYLFGLMVHEGGAESKPRFLDFWAHNRAEERLAFEGFIDFVHARWKQYPDLHIYHYASYEVTAVRRLSVQHGTREAEVDELLRNEVFVDLYTIVSQALFVGEPSYSIKYIEHLYRERRKEGITTAGDSIVEYAKYLASPDGPTWESSPILRGIRDYNRDDCDSTVGLTFWLRRLQENTGLSYQETLPGLSDDDAEESNRGKKTDEPGPDPKEVADRLLAPILAQELGGRELTDEDRMRKLLGELIEFHRRENKQYWWKHYDRLALTHAELIEDSECIGAMVRAGAPFDLKRSKGCRYRFDPAQAVKFQKGKNAQLLIHRDLLVACTIEDLSTERGEIVLKLGPKPFEKAGGQFPELASLLPARPISTKPLEASILRQAVAVLGATLNATPDPDRIQGAIGLSPALERFLRRASPKLFASVESPSSGRGSNLGFQVSDIARLDSSYLCVQGPPGAGKTYNASRAILDLLARENVRIGITSNSHSAIANLMTAVLKAAGVEEGSERSPEELPFAVIKVKSTTGDEDETLAPLGVRLLGSGDVFSALHAEKRAVLVGGTAWAFAREDLAGTIDWLFVDEAGQVSLANLTAMAPSARNLVLLGDQRQLEQPNQGSHPGDSGESSLKYLLQDHATIPKDLGVFLDSSRRMRKTVCDFISGYFYEGRLHSDPSTEARRLDLPAGLTLIRKSEGILFVPETRGEYSQTNPMEIETIGRILRELKQGQFVETSAKGTFARPIEDSDVLIVAPYNLQVNALREAWPTLRVGTVDKFQGQEAPIVIFSMTASALEEAPRGLEFLLNPNRLNVAISRAQCLAIVVGNPALQTGNASSIRNMQLLNLYCGLMRWGSGANSDAI